MEETIDEIFGLYHDYGNNRYMIGEEVTQIDHMIQTAMVAEREGGDEQTILAAFLHDIGHLVGHRDHLKQMDGWGTMDHDKVGGEYLKSKGFPEKICKLVSNHVEAKRYMVTVDPGYAENLSLASKTTLGYEGGKMSEKEMFEFDRDPLRNTYFQFRRWEEMSKEVNVKLEPIEKYKELMRKVLKNTNEN